jgi:prolyl-tRNA synthetase
VGDYDRFTEILHNGEWALTWFSGDADAEEKVKNDSQAVSRCFPLEQPYPGKTGPCIVTGKMTDRMAYFAKAY